MSVEDFLSVNLKYAGDFEGRNSIKSYLIIALFHLWQDCAKSSVLILRKYVP